jgi:hypothetical protein
MAQLWGIQSHFHCKVRRNHGNRQSDANPPCCVHCRKLGHDKANRFILNRIDEANGNGNDNVRTGVAGTTADVVFELLLEN